ncbi:MAG: aminopeptidase P N-terminal domain-containing protein [Planctomycetota bacterium]
MTTTTPPTIEVKEYAERRLRLLESLGNSVGIVVAGSGSGSLHESFRPHAHFEYLTGIVDEPGAILLLDPGAPSPARRALLFLKPRDPEVERWDGHRPGIDSALRQRLGIQSVFRTPAFPRFLQGAARRQRSIACLHPLAAHDQPVSPDLEIAQKVAARVPGLEIVDRSDAVAQLRAVKSPAEIACLAHAVEITAHGFAAALGMIRPGIREFDIEEALHHGYRTHGARGPGYGTIVGSGLQGTVLHYRANSAEVLDGELIVIDSGARFGEGEGGYGADITRTFPANGRFTERQREIYSIVLRAQEAAIAASVPGATFDQIDGAARTIIQEAGFGDAYIHGIGHHLGLETHDATPPGPVEENAVITIEPGIYLPDERLGVRIEDDVRVAPGGGEILGPPIPKGIDEIEAMMAGGR